MTATAEGQLTAPRDLPPAERVGELPTPSLLVDRDRLESNIATMAGRYAQLGIALRPHVKTSKCWEVARRQLTAGAVGFTCSTPAEIVWLRSHGVRDLLWAYEPVGPRNVGFVAQAARHGGLTVALDSLECAEPLAAAAAEASVEVPFLLEVNTGQARAGVEPDRAGKVAGAIGRLAGLRIRGVMTHEGHLGRHVGDAAGRRRAGAAAGQLLVDVAEALRGDGHDIGVVSIGSTPGADSAPFVPGITEARPGTYVYYDANQVRLESAGLSDCALTVLARVISVQRSGTAIIDAGVKAMSSDAIAAAGSLGIVCDPDGTPTQDLVFSDANEEHGFLTGTGTRSLAVGQIVRIVPNHACGTTNMWSQVHVVSGDQVLARWPISARH